MTLTPSDVASLSAKLSRWEIGEYVSEGFVILACAGELLADLGRRCLQRRVRERVERWSTMLLVASLIAALICLQRTNHLSGLVIGSLSDKAEKADAKAQSAIDKSGVAETKSESADEKADKIGERLRAASNLLDLLGPRSLLLERNKDAFIKDLSPRAGQRIIIVSCGAWWSGDDNTEEPNKLGEDLIAFLGPKGAGWAVEQKYATWNQCAVSTLSDPPGVGGIVLVLSTTQDVKAKHSATVSAKKLEDTLNKLRITTSKAPDARVQTMSMSGEANSLLKFVNEDPKAVFLLVGDNPLFTLTKRRTK